MGESILSHVIQLRFFSSKNNSELSRRLVCFGNGPMALAPKFTYQGCCGPKCLDISSYIYSFTSNICTLVHFI
jgi:hypothetical protein